MIDSDKLSSAVAAGVLDSQQAERLSRFMAQNESVADEEQFKLIGGFNDIFVTIGLFLVFGAIIGLTGPGSTIFLAIGAWCLAEVFTRSRRMALPSICLSLAFVCSVSTMASSMFGGSGRFTYSSLLISLLPVGAIICLTLAALLHYWRFRVAIDVTLAVAGLASLAIVAAYQFVPDQNAMIHRFLAVSIGVAIFAFAMSFDLQDPGRVTHRSDVAFWLHLLAAQLIVHGLLGGSNGFNALLAKNTSALYALTVLGVTTIFIFIALLIDRRALIVSALAYAGFAISILFSGGGPSFILLILGVAILGLSVGWKSLRRLIVPRLPLGSLVARLPPVG